MKVLLRADASLTIGTGHVMRCLTLARMLAGRGAEIAFACRAHPGNLIAPIEAAGFQVHSLPLSGREDAEGPAHAAWLGGHWQDEAGYLAGLVADAGIDWVVVDHYALDIRFEAAMIRAGASVMVIDDLADRRHDCRLLLDQTFGRAAADYLPLVPADARILCGAEFALLRPEFAAAAPASLARRRAAPRIDTILVTLGGVDAGNVTGALLDGLAELPLPAATGIDVVMGATAPWRDAVTARAATMPNPTRVHTNVTDMAGLMARADLAIGAAGSTAWERCCLGLPSLMVVIADNQREIAKGLSAAGAAITLGRPEQADFVLRLRTAILALLESPQGLLALSEAAARITDGSGAMRVARAMLEISAP
ncbi:MAG: UDP-2,4-diacetamido-2,4,6-trideoxy-beta-L-altropyranose hydrolase [Pelagibacterium sp. SCN 64-44]|nr:MAG: UDP-2,4-diacetamido-2,4,6-trideoxy-beta-L-altropyranose hydrolase [Pelagibacterium sp. SCN 64-44]